MVQENILKITPLVLLLLAITQGVLGTLCPCSIAHICSNSVEEHDANEVEHCECKPAPLYTFDTNEQNDTDPIPTHFESLLIPHLASSETARVQHFHTVPLFPTGPALFVQHCALLI